MDRNGKRLMGAALIAVGAVAALVWGMGWLDAGHQPTTKVTGPTPAAVPAAQPPVALAAAPCAVPTDILPIAPTGVTRASIVPTGLAADGYIGWIVSGLIFRCADSGLASLDIQTPPEMGVTATAALQMSVTGVKFWPENEATENKATFWRLRSAPAIKVKDPTNTDPQKNVLTLNWEAELSRVVSYELAYTVSLSQKK